MDEQTEEEAMKAAIEAGRLTGDGPEDVAEVVVPDGDGE